jgi:hypothetical protein
MQSPENMAHHLQTEYSGSDFYVVGVLVVIFAFFIYTVIVPKLNKKDKE